MLRERSPAQIRAQAATAFRRRTHLAIVNAPIPMRPPEHGETPLSIEERRFAIDKGLIRPFLGEMMGRTPA